MNIQCTVCGADLSNYPGHIVQKHVDSHKCEIKKVEGWMDSTDFFHELGDNPHGNTVYPSKQDCEKAHSCIAESQGSDWECNAHRVYVFDADKFDAK